MLDREFIEVYALAKKLAQEPLSVIIRALGIVPAVARKALEMRLDQLHIYGREEVIRGWEQRIQKLK